MAESTTSLIESKSCDHTERTAQPEQSASPQPVSSSSTQSAGAKVPSRVRKTSPTVISSGGRVRW